MEVTLQQLEDWLQLPSEHERLEFKEVKTQFEFERLVEYCVAIANEGGGYVVLGVSDKSPRKVVGTAAYDIPERTVTGIYERLNFQVVATKLDHKDGRVLVFSIPSRAKGNPVHYKGRYLMRAGDALVPMSPEKLREIFDESKPKFELRKALSGVSAQKVVQMLDTQCYFDLMKLPYPSSRSRVLERFERENLIARDSKNYSITNLGALLFAKNLDEFENLMGKAAVVTVFEGNSKLKILRDRFFEVGYAVGFEGMVDFVYSQLPHREEIRSAIREAKPMFPKVAIRELVANALIHQDFNMTGIRVMVDIFANRLEISNPGLPLINTDRFIDEFGTRNERLINLMRRLGICEERGSGVDKAIDAIENFQLPPPDFRVGQVRTSVVMFSREKWGEMSRVDKLRACYQHCVLKYVLGEKFTNQSLRIRLGFSDRQVAATSRLINSALDEGLIKTKDPMNTSRRYAEYIPYWA